MCNSYYVEVDHVFETHKSLASTLLLLSYAKPDSTVGFEEFTCVTEHLIHLLYLECYKLIPQLTCLYAQPQRCSYKYVDLNSLVVFCSYLSYLMEHAFLAWTIHAFIPYGCGSC
jgi:hypothetical protein